MSTTTYGTTALTLPPATSSTPQPTEAECLLVARVLATGKVKDWALYRTALHHVLASGGRLSDLVCRAWASEDGQDVAEYAVMLAVILVIVVGTIHLIGSQANNVFSQTASAIGG